MLEFAQCFVVMLFGIAILVNLGQFLWKLQAAADAVLFGARYASYSQIKNRFEDCSDLTAAAAANAEDQLEKTGAAAGGALGTPLAEIVTGTYDGTTVQLVRVSLRHGDAASCIFCLQNFILRLGLTISSASPTMLNCT